MARRSRIGEPSTQTSTYVAGVSGTSLAGPVDQVVVNAAGQLGTTSAPDLSAILTTLQNQQAQLDGQQKQVDAQNEQIDKLRKKVQKLSRH